MDYSDDLLPVIDWFLFFPFQIVILTPFGGLFFFGWAYVGRLFFFGLCYFVQVFLPLARLSHPFGSCVKCFDVMEVNFRTSGNSVAQVVIA